MCHLTTSDGVLIGSSWHYCISKPFYFVLAVAASWESGQVLWEIQETLTKLSGVLSFVSTRLMMLYICQQAIANHSNHTKKLQSSYMNCFPWMYPRQWIDIESIKVLDGNRQLIFSTIIKRKERERKFNIAIALPSWIPL